MKPKIKDYASAQFVKFLIVSSLAAGVNFTSRIVINIFLSYSLSIILAYIIGMITAFSLNKLFVFEKAASRTTKQFVIFTLINVLAILQTLVVSLALRDFIFPLIYFSFHPSEVAHFIGLGIPLFTSFLGHKYISFARVTKQDDEVTKYSFTDNDLLGDKTE